MSVVKHKARVLTCPGMDGPKEKFPAPLSLFLGIVSKIIPTFSLELINTNLIDVSK